MNCTLTLCSRRIPLVLAVAVVALALAHLAGKISSIYLGYDTVYGLVPLFDLTVENNIPTFYSALALLLAAILFGLVAAPRWRSRAGDQLYWAVLVLVFVVLAYDELFQVHERLTRPTHAALGMSSRAYYAWTIPVGILTLLFGAFFLRFALRLPARIRNLFVLAAALYVVGALGMELLGGMIVRDPHNLGRVFVNMLEEVLEMTGIVVLIRALLLYLEELRVGLRFGTGDDRDGQGPPGSPADATV